MQGRQAALDEAPAADSVPAAHGVGAVAPRAQKKPAGHAVHVADAAPPREKEPAGHAFVHVLAVAELVVP